MPEPIDLDEMERRQPRKPLDFEAIISIAMEALGSRALVWVVTVAGGGLWYLIIDEPSTLKIVTASLFCLTILVPILWRDTKR